MISSLVELPLALVWVALALHLEGERRAAKLRGPRRDKLARRRAALFYAGLATIVIALSSPIDSLSETLFWVHMTQHVLLLTVAAPLIVLGAPWMSMWRPLPLSWRRATARTVARSPSLRPLRAGARALGRPLGAWLAFSIDLVVWHIPAVYDVTLRNVAVHALEHATFLLVGILLWAQVLASPPLRVRLAPLERVRYMLAATVVGWVISLVLAFATTPLYPFYAHLSHRPGEISALVDQQLAAGVMLVPGSLTMSMFVFIGLYRWLGQDEEERRREPRRPPATDAGGVTR
jgi:cytochrome c oxidase assembly factor CtaG